jgi:hypothetical protein
VFMFCGSGHYCSLDTLMPPFSIGIKDAAPR